MSVVFLDTETTGLDPERHELWEVALIEEDGTEHEWRWWPALKDADPTALRITRFYERVDARESQHPPCGLADEILALTAGKHLVGAVPSFDAAFLTRYLRQVGRVPAWHYHLIDVETLAIGWLAGGAGRVWSPEHPEPPRSSYVPPWNSDGLSFSLGIDAAQFERHTALDDARWAKAIYETVMR